MSTAAADVFRALTEVSDGSIGYLLLAGDQEVRRANAVARRALRLERVRSGRERLPASIRVLVARALGQRRETGGDRPAAGPAAAAGNASGAAAREERARRRAASAPTFEGRDGLPYELRAAALRASGGGAGAVVSIRPLAGSAESAFGVAGGRLGLTPREAKVLALVAAGATTKEAAGALSIGEATVKTHVLHLLEKLGVRTRAEAVARVTRAAAEVGARGAGVHRSVD